MKTTSETKPAGLVGRYFHIWDDEGSNIARQGRVIAQIDPTHYLVQFYDWLMGEPSTLHIYTLDAFLLNTRANGAMLCDYSLCLDSALRPGMPLAGAFSLWKRHEAREGAHRAPCRHVRLRKHRDVRLRALPRLPLLARVCQLGLERLRPDAQEPPCCKDGGAGFLGGLHGDRPGYGRLYRGCGRERKRSRHPNLFLEKFKEQLLYPNHRGDARRFAGEFPSTAQDTDFPMFYYAFLIIYFRQCERAAKLEGDRFCPCPPPPFKPPLRFDA
jgi:hypothetical protein